MYKRYYYSDMLDSRLQRINIYVCMYRKAYKTFLKFPMLIIKLCEFHMDIHVFIKFCADIGNDFLHPSDKLHILTLSSAFCCVLLGI
jgi:hypothetical protein